MNFFQLFLLLCVTNWHVVRLIDGKRPQSTLKGDTRRIQKAVHAAAADALSRGIQNALRQV